MRVLSLTVAIVTIACFASAEVRTGDRANTDHLSPVNRGDESINKYRALLAAKLGVTPFDCGRVVDTSSFGPETFVSVYSQMRNGRRVYYVTSVQAEANLWQRTKSMHEVGKARGVGVRRIDAEIPQSIAQTIRQIWLRMLHDLRPAPPLGLEFVMNGYLDFSIQQSAAHSLDGELGLPAPGPKTQALVKISDGLWEYCQATPAKRPAIANKIDLEVKHLLAQLK